MIRSTFPDETNYIVVSDPAMEIPKSEPEGNTMGDAMALLFTIC